MEHALISAWPLVWGVQSSYLGGHRGSVFVVAIVILRTPLVSKPSCVRLCFGGELVC